MLGFGWQETDTGKLQQKGMDVLEGYQGLPESENLEERKQGNSRLRRLGLSSYSRNSLMETPLCLDGVELDR